MFLIKKYPFHKTGNSITYYKSRDRFSLCLFKKRIPFFFYSKRLALFHRFLSCFDVTLYNAIITIGRITPFRKNNFRNYGDIPRAFSPTTKCRWNRFKRIINFIYSTTKRSFNHFGLVVGNVIKATPRPRRSPIPHPRTRTARTGVIRGEKISGINEN